MIIVWGKFWPPKISSVHKTANLLHTSTEIMYSSSTSSHLIHPFSYSERERGTFYSRRNIQSMKSDLFRNHQKPSEWKTKKQFKNKLNIIHQFESEADDERAVLPMDQSLNLLSYKFMTMQILNNVSQVNEGESSEFINDHSNCGEIKETQSRPICTTRR